MPRDCAPGLHVELFYLKKRATSENMWFDNLLIQLSLNVELFFKKKIPPCAGNELLVRNRGFVTGNSLLYHQRRRAKKALLLPHPGGDPTSRWGGRKQVSPSHPKARPVRAERTPGNIRHATAGGAREEPKGFFAAPGRGGP
jgi:hypothetical protein